MGAITRAGNHSSADIEPYHMTVSVILLIYKSVTALVCK